jgi:hypothetical protein
MDIRTLYRASNQVAALLLLAVLCLGIAWLAVLPPWEGFDETAHWSYIQQLSDTGKAPRYGVDHLAADVDAYRGPMRYGETPPFEKTGHMTYREAGRASLRGGLGGPTTYRQGRSLNWQSQHPPLYYIVMGAAYRLTRTLGWVPHLFVLRLTSFLIAFAGLTIGVLTTRAYVRSIPGMRGVWVGPIMAAWPLIFPQFIPEFARLGNDSLCLLLTSLAWALLLDILRDRRSWMVAPVLGLVLGCGLLTKAFFLPISGGIGVVLLARFVLTRRIHDLGQALAVGLLAVAVGGGWYLSRQAETGSLIGADEFIRLNAMHGGASLSVPEFARGTAAIIGTFLWAGTWSLARLPEIFLLAPFATLCVVGVAYGRGLPPLSLNGQAGDLASWAPIALAAPLAAGLLYHVYAWVMGAAAVTPGWYFHILATPLGFAVALGWRRPRLLAATLGTTGLLTLASWAAQLSLYGGCAAKLGADKHYSLAGTTCVVNVDALGAIGSPLVGAVFLVGGLTAAGIAGWFAWSNDAPAAAADRDELLPLTL